MRGFSGVAVGRWSWWGVIVAIATLLAICYLALARLDARAATGEVCVPTCVILIQVDGLEPKDVTPQSTPYLWGLAHPQAAGTSSFAGALANRSGFVWQAPR